MPSPSWISPATPVASAVRVRLHRRLGRQYPVGSRIPPVRHLAQEMGVAPGSIHRAIKGLVADGLLRAQPRLGVFVAAQSGRRVRRDAPIDRSLAMYHVAVYSTWVDAFLFRMLDGVESVLRPLGAQIERRAPAGTWDDVLVPGDSSDLDGAIVLNPPGLRTIEANAECPAVALSTSAELCVTGPDAIDVVMVEQEQGGLLAGQCLRDAGCPSVCFVGMGRLDSGEVQPAYRETSAARLRGFELGWGSRVPKPRRVYTGSYGPNAGAKGVRAFLAMNPRPDAVFTASDDIALGFVAGALAHGLHPGVDYQIVGFDGQERGRHMVEGSLTTVAVPTFDMGRRAAEMLLERLAHPDQPMRKLLLGCSLYKGTTVRAPAATAPRFDTSIDSFPGPTPDSKRPIQRSAP